MRQIKFRGKDADGVIHYGGYHEDIWGIPSIIDEYGDDFKVFEKSVGQFTCVLDKFGTEIYEGDILIWEDDVYTKSAPCYVKYDESLGGFYLFKEKDVKSKNKLNSYTCNQFYKVIGNMFDNPELVKDD